MSQEARYYRVGLFVIGGLALIVAGVVILGGQDMFVESTRMETYFSESVQGLEVGSPVKMSGVQIGTVAEIGLVPDYYPTTLQQMIDYGQRVVVFMDITGSRGTGASQEALLNLRRLSERGLRVRLSQQGITGVAYIEAEFLPPERYPPMEIQWQPKYPYVPSAPSTISTISTAAERIANRLEDVDVAALTNNLNELIVTATRSVKELRLGELRGEAGRALSEFSATLARAQQSIEAGRYDFEAALENVRVASENIRDLSETAREYPSVLLLGGQPERPDRSTR